MHSSGWMYSISAAANTGSYVRGWMQSTGHTPRHAASLVPMHGSQMIYATWVSSQPRKYNSEHRPHLAAVLGLLTAFGALLHSAPTWRDAPELLPLFAPAGQRSAAYSMRVTDDGLE